MTKVWNDVYVELSSDVAISKWASQLAGVSPSKFDLPSSKLPERLSKRSSGFLADWVIEAVILAVCFAPISITFANS